MLRFLKDTDYQMIIRNEIRRLLDGSAGTSLDTPATPKLLYQAEKTAISQIRKWLSVRYDCDAIFTPWDDNQNPNNDTRDQFIVAITIDIALWHLYSQTPNKDVPAHRAQRYDDALDWLKDAGKGLVGTDLPINDPTTDTDVIIRSRPPENHRW